MKIMRTKDFDKSLAKLKSFGGRATKAANEVFTIITNQVNPRLCRGDSSSLTIPGVHQETPCREPPKHTMKENPDGQTSKPKPHHLGVQISCGVYPEVSSPDALRAAKTASGRGVSQSGPAEGEHD